MRKAGIRSYGFSAARKSLKATASRSRRGLSAGGPLAADDVEPEDDAVCDFHGQGLLSLDVTGTG